MKRTVSVLTIMGVLGDAAKKIKRLEKAKK
jgi:hypothetical protein